MPTRSGAVHHLLVVFHEAEALTNHPRYFRSNGGTAITSACRSTIAFRSAAIFRRLATMAGSRSHNRLVAGHDLCISINRIRRAVITAA